MGELRKKVGMSFMQAFNYILIFVLLFALASVLEYRLIEKVDKTKMDVYIQYLVYILFALSFVFFAVFYIKNKLIISMNVYQNGIVIKNRGRETIMYSDVPTYYLIPRLDKSVKYLIIEKGNGSRVLIDIDYAGDDFMEYFQKDYIAINTDKAINKINAGTELMFGMLSKKQNFMLKIFKGKNTVRKLEFEDKFYISRDYLRYKDLEYNFDMLDIDYDVQTKNIEIKDDSNNIIISTYFSHVEKGEFAFNLMDYLIEQAENKTDNLLIQDSIFQQDSDDIVDINLIESNDNSKEDIEKDKIDVINDKSTID